MFDLKEALGFFAKLWGSILLLIIARLQAGAGFDAWLMITLAGISGMLWQSAVSSFWSRAAAQPKSERTGA